MSEQTWPFADPPDVFGVTLRDIMAIVRAMLNDRY